MKAFIWLLCAALALVARASSGKRDIPDFRCTSDLFRKIRKQCLNVPHVKTGKLSSVTSCSGLRSFVRCIRDNWSLKRCNNSSLAEQAPFLATEKELHEQCSSLNESRFGVLRQQCHPPSAVKVFLRCGREFYSKITIPTNRTVLVLSALCPQVDKYTECVFKSRGRANCTTGRQVLPHMSYIAESVVGRYRTLCRALQNADFQKTTGCNRKRFINDMFLCGYHFSNIAEVMRNAPASAICPYLEKYRTCHNASVEAFGCAPPDQLYDDAHMFFKSLTQRFAGVCTDGSKRRGVVARLTLDSRQLDCDSSRFMQYYFECANNFLKNANGTEGDKQRICRLASIYKYCVSGSLNATRCDTGMELNRHLAYLQNYIIKEYTASCVDPGGTAENSSLNYVPVEEDEDEDDMSSAVPILKAANSAQA